VCEYLQSLSFGRVDVLDGPRGHIVEQPDRTTVWRLIQEQYSDAAPTVPARATKLLKVVLGRRRMLPMDDEAHVGDVDTHTEGIRADDAGQMRLQVATESLE
jgi:hypothetical protein